MIGAEYSTRTISRNPSGGSLHGNSNGQAVLRTLTPNASNGSLHGSGSATALRPLVVREHVPIQQVFPGAQQTSMAGLAPAQYITAVPATSLQQSPSTKSLGQSASVNSLLTVASDTSGPPAMAPPQSAALNTGEVLHPYGNSAQAEMQNSGTYLQRPPPQQLNAGQHMAAVHSQSAMSMNAHQYQAASAPAHQAAGPPPQQVPASQPQWVIEEVIDFGVPLDESGIREYDDNGYPIGCKLALSPRGHAGIFGGCVRSLCYDEEQVMLMQNQGQQQDANHNLKELC